MSELYPRMISSRRIGKTLVAACVGSELHEIGVRMVADFFEMEGWDTFYIGAGNSKGQILSAIQMRSPDLVALSVTMTYHISMLREIIAAIREVFPGPIPRIMVGGLPFNVFPDLSTTVGADAWAMDAGQAVQVAHRLIQSTGTTIDQSR